MPKYVPNYCSIVGCSNSEQSNPQLAFYNFPKNYEINRRMRWIDAVQRHRTVLNKKPFEPTQRTVICSSHFIGGKKSDIASSRSYVPTIFPLIYTRRSTLSTQTVAGCERLSKNENSCTQTEQKSHAHATNTEINSSRSKKIKLEHSYTFEGGPKIDFPLIKEELHENANDTDNIEIVDNPVKTEKIYDIGEENRNFEYVDNTEINSNGIENGMISMKTEPGSDLNATPPTDPLLLDEIDETRTPEDCVNVQNRLESKIVEGINESLVSKLELSEAREALGASTKLMNMQSEVEEKANTTASSAKFNKTMEELTKSRKELIIKQRKHFIAVNRMNRSLQKFETENKTLQTALTKQLNTNQSVNELALELKNENHRYNLLLEKYQKLNQSFTQLGKMYSIQKSELEKSKQKLHLNRKLEESSFRTNQELNNMLRMETNVARRRRIIELQRKVTRLEERYQELKNQGCQYCGL